MAGILCTTLASGLAHAATTTQTQTVDVDAHSPALNTELVFNKFNAADTPLQANKVLTQITITSNLEWWGGYYAIDNESASESSGTATFGAGASLSSVDVFGIPAGASPLVSTLVQNLTLKANDDDNKNFDVGGDDYARIDGPTYANRNSVTGSGNVNPLLFSFYQGVGTFTITYASSQTQSWTGLGGNSTSSGPISAQGYVTITYTYDYDPIPEPTSFALLGLGAAILGLRRRVRKAS